MHQAGTLNKFIITLDTEETGGAGQPLDSTKTYALCYGENGGIPFSDSGIRVTMSRLWEINYLDTKFGHTGPAQYTRTITSLVQTFNKIPQAADQQVTYDGPLAAQKYLSLIDTTANSNFPCHNPSVAAVAADSDDDDDECGDGDGGGAASEHFFSFVRTLAAFAAQQAPGATPLSPPIESPADEAAASLTTRPREVERVAREIHILKSIRHPPWQGHFGPRAPLP